MAGEPIMGATGKDPDNRGQRVFWDTKLFDEKMTLNPLYRYNGVSGGDEWHRRAQFTWTGGDWRCAWVAP